MRTLTANTSPHEQEWFGDMLINPREAFMVATKAIIEGSFYHAMPEYQQGGLGRGGGPQPHVDDTMTPPSATMTPPDSPEQQQDQAQTDAQDSGDVTVDTSSQDHSGDSTVMVPDTPPTTDVNMDMDQAWINANEQARLAKSPRPAGEKHGRQSSPSSSDLFPAKRTDSDDRPTKVPDSQLEQLQRVTVATQRTTTRGQAQETTAKKGFFGSKSGKAPASHGANKPPQALQVPRPRTRPRENPNNGHAQPRPEF